MVAAGVSTAVAWGVGRVLPGDTDDVTHVLAAMRVVVLGGIDVGVFLLLARAMRISRGHDDGRHTGPPDSAGPVPPNMGEASDARG